MLPFEIEEQKKIKVTNEGVYILDDELKAEINKKKLSPSFVNSYDKSPGECILSSFIEPLVRTEEPIYFARGHWFHSIMEEHFMNPERNLKTLKEDFQNMTKGQPKFAKGPNDKNEYLNLARDTSNKEWMIECLQGFTKLAKREDFYKKRVATLYSQGRQKPGIEFFVQTKFDNIQNNCLGFVDCILEDEGGLKIVDWKTGKYHAGSPDYEFQQTLYAMMLENIDLTVQSAELAFPIGDGNGNPVVEKINIKDEKVREEVMNKLKKVDSDFEKHKKDYFFPFIKHQWNNWESFLTGNGRAPKPNINEDQFYKLANLEEII